MVEKMLMRIFEKAPAKINLSLDILHKREDGYHEVEMIMTMVDLADRLEFTPLHRDTIIITSQVGFIPLDDKNLAVQAARLIKERCGIDRGVHIHLDKHIPVAAGLAGGSTDAAATFRGLNRMWDLRLTDADMQKLGEEIGSDVPFCVAGGTAIATGRGEKLQPIESPPQCWVILAKPPIHVSTSDVYGKVQASNIKNHPDSKALLSAINDQDFHRVCSSIGNVLEEITLELYPEVKRIKECMVKLGAEGVLMSGSGPTVFGLVSKHSRVHRIYNGLRGFCKEVYVVRSLRNHV
jgi:4-diphosphocytidyl-2-C-methyl-D-erythritol kinase